MATKSKSLRDWAAVFGVSYQTIQNIKKEGINLDDAESVISRLSESPDYVIPPDYVHLIPKGKNSTQGTKGLTAAIERLRECELVAHNNYLDALKVNAANSAALLKNWNLILDQLRKMEESNPDILQANANSINKEDLSKVLGDLFKTLRQDLEALPERVSTIGQHTNRDALKSIMQTETNKIIDMLSNWKGFNSE